MVKTITTIVIIMFIYVYIEKGISTYINTVNIIILFKAMIILDLHIYIILELFIVFIVEYSTFIFLSS